MIEVARVPFVPEVENPVPLGTTNMPETVSTSIMMLELPGETCAHPDIGVAAFSTSAGTICANVAG